MFILLGASFSLSPCVACLYMAYSFRSSEFPGDDGSCSTAFWACSKRVHTSLLANTDELWNWRMSCLWEYTPRTHRIPPWQIWASLENAANLLIIMATMPATHTHTQESLEEETIITCTCLKTTNQGMCKLCATLRGTCKLFKIFKLRTSL